MNDHEHRALRCPRPRVATHLVSAALPRRDEGVALMVVMILFVILTLVVYQLQYSTKLEEELAEVRATDSMGTFAVSAVVSHVITVLAEDFRESRMNASEAGGAPAAMGAPPGEGGQGPGPGLEPGGDGDSRGVVQERSQDGAAAAGAGGAAADPGTFDYVLKTIFMPDTKTLNGVSVKFRLVDNERCINLNRMWELPRLEVEGLTEEQELAAEEQARMEGEEGDPEAEDAGEGTGGANIDPRAILEAAQRGEPTTLNSSESTWVPPDEPLREMTREMLTRAIELVMILNQDRGFLYRYQMPSAAQVAVAIEDYCFWRRSQDYQNRVNLVSELLNLDLIPPELYYGPSPEILPGEEFYDYQQLFAYTRDEFGDLVGEALYASDEWAMDREYRQVELEQLMSVEGPYASFPGLGRMGNPLTRGMQDYADDYDGLGKLVPPQPLGLRDIFCTHSTGKINLNTASPPVIYGILLSLESEEAMKVALDLEAYRYLYQEEMSEEEAAGDIEGAGAGAGLNLGQPRRQPPPEESELGPDGEEQLLTGTVGLENPETNYFTDLRQLVLIDGEDGGPEDLLTENTGVEVIDADFKTPFQLVRDDLQRVVVFGSSYFTAILKIKTDKSPLIKEGYALLHRDAGNRRIEVIQYKELER